MFNSKLVGVLVTIVIGIPGLILGGIGTYNAFNVISSHIKDGTVEEKDLKDILDAKIKLPDGQVLDTQIFFKDVDGSGVLGLTTDKGFWRVFVQEDALGVVPPVGGIGSEEIEDGSISADDLGVEFLSSVDGVSNDGGNVDFVGGTGINVTPNDGADSVAFAVDFADLDPVYVNVTGDTITGDLTVNGTTTVNDLVVKGSSTHYGPETYYDIIDAQGDILNTAGNLILNDNTEILGTLDVNGNTVLYSDLTVFGSSYHYGKEYYYEDNRFYEDVWLGDGNEDRIVIPGPISSGDGGPLNIQDNSGLLVERRDNGNDLFSVDGSGNAEVFGDLTVDKNTTLGLSSTDSLVVNATIDSNLIPVDSLYDLGAPGSEWAHLYVDDLVVTGSSTHYGPETYYDDINAEDRIVNNVGDLLLDDNVDVTGILDAQDSIVNTGSDNICYTTVIGPVCTTGAVFIDDDLNVDGDVLINGNQGIVGSLAVQDYLIVGQDSLLFGDLYLLGDSFHYGEEDYYDTNRFHADVYLGDNAGDTLYANGDFATDLDVDVTDTYDIGRNLVRWQDGYFARVFAGVDGAQTILRDNGLRTEGANLVLATTNAGEDVVFNPASNLVRSDATIRPQLDGTYDLGSAARRWDEIFAYSLDLAGNLTLSGDLTVLGNSYHTGVEEFYNDIDAQDVITNTIGDLLLDDSVDVSGDLDVTGDAYVTGATTLYGDVNLGDTGTDAIGGFGRFTRDLTPMTDNAYNLGTATERWATLFGYDADLAGTLTVEDLVVNNDASLGDASGWGGTDILSVDTTGANGPEACCAPTYEVTIDGDLKVTGAIDPTGILLEPVGNGDTAIQVNNTGGTAVFEVTENGRIESNGNIDLVGGLITSNKASGEVVINGQLSVTDLVVSGDAAFNGTASFDTDVNPAVSDVYDMGTSLLRWSDIFAVNADLSGDLSVTGTATVGTLVVGATNVSTELGNLATAIGLLQTEDTNLDTRLDDLEVGYVTVGGVDTTCTTLGATCVIAVAPAGKTIVSFSATPIGTGNLRIKLTANAAGGTTASVIVLGAAGDTVTGVSWVATVQ